MDDNMTVRQGGATHSYSKKPAFFESKTNRYKLKKDPKCKHVSVLENLAKNILKGNTNTIHCLTLNECTSVLAFLDSKKAENCVLKKLVTIPQARGLLVARMASEVKEYKIAQNLPSSVSSKGDWSLEVTEENKSLDSSSAIPLNVNVSDELTTCEQLSVLALVVGSFAMGVLYSFLDKKD